MASFPRIKLIYIQVGQKESSALKQYHYPQLKVETPRVKHSDIANVVSELQGFTAYDVEHFLCVDPKRW